MIPWRYIQEADGALCFLGVGRGRRYCAGLEEGCQFGTFNAVGVLMSFSGCAFRGGDQHGGSRKH
jgi:hypothetical protein